MTFSIRRALGVAVVAAAAGVAELTAQGSPPPQVTVGGVVYTQYLYQLKDSVNHFNNFDITRAYVNVLGKFSGGVGTRVTADIYRNTDGSLSYRLKYAFATYTPQGSPLTFKIGQIHTPWLDWEDALARISVRVLDTDDSSRVGGLRVTGYAGYGRAANGDRNRFLGMVSYRSKHLTLAGEAASAQNGSLGTINGHVYSGFGVYKVPDSKVAILARVDITHLQSGATDKQTRFIGGVSYQLSPNWRLLGDWDYANYQTDALDAGNYG